jgi:hypothetical protein
VHSALQRHVARTAGSDHGLDDLRDLRSRLHLGLFHPCGTGGTSRQHRPAADRRCGHRAAPQYLCADGGAGRNGDRPAPLPVVARRRLRQRVIVDDGPGVRLSALRHRSTQTECR